MPDSDAVRLLKDDHQRIKDLFGQFKHEEDPESKSRLAEQAMMELTVHSAVEEELFYPALRREIDDETLVDEAVQEHHVFKLLVSELASMKPGDEGYGAKFEVMSEIVKRHIEDEESQLLPQVELLGLDGDVLGRSMRESRQRLAGQAASAHELIEGISARHSLRRLLRRRHPRLRGGRPYAKKA